MAYATITELITYMAHDSDFASSTTDYDVTLNYNASVNALARAQTIIETLTGRVFEAAVSTRKFDAVEDVDGLTLFLDDDLFASDVSDTDLVITNGDGNALADTDYIFEPRNKNPRWAITILGSVGKYWQESTVGDNENAISVAAKWGYSKTAPNDIKQATLRLARWLYHQRTTELDVDNPIVTPQGVLVLPGKIPADVLSILAFYQKPRNNL